MDAAELAFAGVARQAELIRAGEVSPTELLDVCLERIDRIDGDLNSFRVVMADEARAEAEQAEERRGSDGGERPLLGVPIAVKDNVDVAGQVTTHGTDGGGTATRDSEVVRRLREAGAVIVGKTLLPEFAIFGFTESATWGVTRNPWDRTRVPGGSSGGSAAAVAAGLVGGAEASDGLGSIRIPAACCGLVGIKPQRGRVSLLPDPEHWHGLSVSGPLGRRTLDCAVLLDAMAGPAPGDVDTPPPPDRSYVEAARSAPGKLRIAMSLQVFNPPGRVDPGVSRGVEATAEVLRSLGHDVRERDPDYGQMLPLLLPRSWGGVANDLDALPHPERTERRTRTVARFGRALRPFIPRVRAAEAAAAARVNAIFQDFDVVMTPVVATPPYPLRRYEGRGAIWTATSQSQFAQFTPPWNLTGQPAAAVPAPTHADGLPVGVQLMGRPNDEGTLISLAAQLEAEVGWPERRPPVE